MTDRQRRQTVAIAAGVGGVALFAYAVTEAGVPQIAEHVSRVGWGLLPILALAGVRFLFRAEAWRLCTPVGSRLTLRRAFVAFLAGDALGNVTPLGLFASEPAKVFLTRHHLATRQSMASLAVDNAVYALSVVTMVAAGLGVMIATVPLSLEVQELIVALLVVVTIASLGGIHMLRRLRGTHADRHRRWLRPLTSAWRAVMEMSAGHPVRLWRAFTFHLLFHAAAILETYFALAWLLGDRSPTIAEAVMFESLNRVITTAFKFVPLRIGIDEAATGAFAALLGVNPTYGVALAVVRKVRGLFWVGTGLALIAVHHMYERPSTERVPSQTMPARSGSGSRAAAFLSLTLPARSESGPSAPTSE